MGKRTPEQCREYRLTHLEQVLENDRQYRLKSRKGNPVFLEKAKIRNKEYYQLNKERITSLRRGKDEYSPRKTTETTPSISGWLLILRQFQKLT